MAKMSPFFMRTFRGLFLLSLVLVLSIQFVTANTCSGACYTDPNCNGDCVKKGDGWSCQICTGCSNAGSGGKYGCFRTKTCCGANCGCYDGSGNEDCYCPNQPNCGSNPKVNVHTCTCDDCTNPVSNWGCGTDEEESDSDYEGPEENPPTTVPPTTTPTTPVS